MKEKIKKWTDACISFIINRTIWAFIVWVSSLVVLNIPMLLSVLKAYGEKFATFSNFTTFLSAISLVLGLYAAYRLHLINKKQNVVSDTMVTSEQPAEAVECAAEPEQDEEVADDGLIRDIHYNKATVEMYIKSPAEILYTLKVDGKVGVDSIDHYYKELTWTGDKYIGTRVKRSNIECCIENNTEKRTVSPYSYIVYFDEEQKNGEEIKLALETKVSDNNIVMLPYNMFCVKYPVDLLEVSLIIDPTYVRSVYKSCYRDLSREVPISRDKNVERHDVGDMQKFVCKIEKPKPWKWYGLEWTFTDKYKSLRKERSEDTMEA